MFIERLKDEEVIEFVKKNVIMFSSNTKGDLKVDRLRKNAIRYISLYLTTVLEW